jgi:hypothetical protein
MRLIPTTLLFILTCSSVFGQYSPIEPQNLTLENYSRQEIRSYLLMMEREDSKIYELARKSKFNRNCSYVFYGLSAASLIVSISNFSTLDEIPLSNMIERSVSEGVARFLLGAAIVELGLGIWNTHRSRTRLNQALQQFR